jgi:predicted site-specific integrase-resolvase
VAISIRRDLQDGRRHITAPEAEACLGIRAGTVRRWAHAGRLHPVSTDKGGVQWYLLADILDLMRRPSYLHRRAAIAQVRRAR